MTYNFKRFDNGRLAYEREVNRPTMLTKISTFTRLWGYKTLVNDVENGIVIIHNKAKGQVMQWTRIAEES